MSRLPDAYEDREKILRFIDKLIIRSIGAAICAGTILLLCGCSCPSYGTYCPPTSAAQ